MENSGNRFLDGVRIVEIGDSDTLRMAGMFLADQGADVVRIGNEKQDTGRPLCRVTDRAKRFISFDFDKTDQPEGLKSLLGRVDVLLEDRGATLLQRFGNGKSLPETLIHCSITPYAASSGKAGRPWTEETVSADAGLYEPLGGVGSPRFFDLPIASVISALHAANAVAMALAGRARSGWVYRINIPIERCALFANAISIMIRSKAPTAWEPFRMYSTPFMGVWKTAGNGYIYLHVAMPRHLRSFVFLLDKLGFHDEKKAIKGYLEKTSKRDPSMLGSAREALGITKVLTRLFITRSAAEWEDILGREGLCCNKVRPFDEWRDHDQVVRSGEIFECRLGDGSVLKAPGPVFASEILGGSSPLPAGPQALSLAECLEQWPARETFVPKQCDKLPLEGLKVLDLSRVIAGPYAGRLLAEYGAEVLQVSLRTTHLSWEEPFHIFYGPGKDSVTIEYSSPEGKDAFKKIIEKFKPDIVLHNFLEDAARKIGVDYESCRRWNKEIIYIDIQGYNAAGPWADRPGFEQNIQAASGILSSYSRGSAPRILPVPINDLSAGLIASFGAALSVLNLVRNRRGNRITCYLSMPSVLIQLHRLNGGDERARFSDWFRAADGWFLLSCSGDWRRSLHALPGFASMVPGALADPATALAPVFRKKPIGWWQEQVRRAGAEGAIHILPRLNLAKILAQGLSGPEPIFSYRNHEGIGDVLFAHSPVVLAPVPVKAIDPAKFIGSSTRAWAARAGFDPARHCPVIPRPRPDNGLLAGIRRMVWLFSQIKWLAVIAYRQKTSNSGR